MIFVYTLINLILSVLVSIVILRLIPVLNVCGYFKENGRWFYYTHDHRHRNTFIVFAD